jgi:hypothetical protein
VKSSVLHYIQCFITGNRPAGPNLGDTDGIVELWFDNINGFNAFANSPSYLNVIKLDEERLTDPKKCQYFFGKAYDHKYWSGIRVVLKRRRSEQARRTTNVTAAPV